MKLRVRMTLAELEGKALTASLPATKVKVLSAPAHARVAATHATAEECLEKKTR